MSHFHPARAVNKACQACYLPLGTVYPNCCGKNSGTLYMSRIYGIILDSVRMEARLPNDKVERIQTSLDNFKSRKSCTLRELQVLIGTLNFACRVVPPGRPFLQRMIELTR